MVVHRLLVGQAWLSQSFMRFTLALNIIQSLAYIMVYYSV
jgi:hypothetical protein